MDGRALPTLSSAPLQATARIRQEPNTHTPAALCGKSSGVKIRHDSPKNPRTWAGLMSRDTRECECQVGQEINADASVMASGFFFVLFF